MFVPSIFLILIFFLGLIYFLIKIKQFNDLRNRINLLPGPKTVPILGNLLDIIGPQEYIFKIIREYAKRFKADEVVRVWLAHIPTVNIIHPDDIETLISSTRHNSKGLTYQLLHKWLGTGLLTSDGDKWHLRRKILTPTFHFNILQQFLPVFTEQSKVLVDVLKKNTDKTVDVVPLITQFTLHSVCETAMGISLPKLTQEEKYKNAVYKMGEFFMYRTTRPWFFYDACYMLTKNFWTQRGATRVLHDFSRNVIEKRKKSIVGETSYSKRKQLAMLDMLLSAQKQGIPIDDEGIREEVDTFMFEGHDTTSMSICFSLMLFACHQEVQEKIYREIREVLGDSDRDLTLADLHELKYLEMCIKESLRLYPSVPIISRMTNSDIVTRSGHIIPKGVNVHVHIYDTHRKEDVYPNPSVFDPDRFSPENTQNRHPFAYIPFSAGPRNCIGQKFAIMEMKTVLSNIVRHFILEPVDTPETLVMLSDMVLRSKDGVKMKLIERTT